MKRNLNTLDDFIKNVHKLGYAILDYRDSQIPCLYIENNFFETILKISYDNKSSVDTNLNIYDNGHYIFVDINLKFLNTNLEENFLLYANDNIDFFYNLASAGILGLAPATGGSESSIFFIQLPKKDHAEKAYNMIKSKLNKAENKSSDI